ncbi:MAG: dUTP diphosphatase [Muribaculaceae bacterium]
MSVDIINEGRQPDPSYATPDAAGMDIRADLDSPVTILPGDRALIPTGLRVAIPAGFEMQMRPRSGLALKHGITLANSPGTIDADYRGPVGVIIINHGKEPFVVNPGERICQAVVAPVMQVSWNRVDSLPDTARGDGGFGHTGVK